MLLRLAILVFIPSAILLAPTPLDPRNDFVKETLIADLKENRKAVEAQIVKLGGPAAAFGYLTNRVEVLSRADKKQPLEEVFRTHFLKFWRDARDDGEKAAARYVLQLFYPNYLDCNPTSEQLLTVAAEAVKMGKVPNVALHLTETALEKAKTGKEVEVALKARMASPHTKYSQEELAVKMADSLLHLPPKEIPAALSAYVNTAQTLAAAPDFKDVAPAVFHRMVDGWFRQGNLTDTQIGVLIQLAKELQTDRGGLWRTIQAQEKPRIQAMIAFAVQQNPEHATKYATNETVQAARKNATSLPEVKHQMAGLATLAACGEDLARLRERIQLSP